MAAETTIGKNDKDVTTLITDLGKAAKAALPSLASLQEEQVNEVLFSVAKTLRDNTAALLEANAKDTEAAKNKGLPPALIDRLMLDEKRIEAMAQGVENIARLDDHMGRTLWETQRPNGLKIKRIAVPIGVLGMIYESRPNVTIDAAALCLKSRNAVILRGGSESIHSSTALCECITQALEQHELPKAAVSMVPTTDRKAVGAMLACSDYIDVIIPRGGKSLIERVMTEARMPVFGHLEGLCHIYVDQSARPDIAKEVTLNAKMRRTGICGAMETLLLDKNLDQDLAKDILSNLLEAGCEIVGDEAAQSLNPDIKPASESDWQTEYLDARLSVRIVDGVDEAIAHINEYGSHHTDSILAEDEAATEKFRKLVDSGIVMHNCSTQFADGGEFGMGAEIGIATGKLHARGPVGVEQLMSYKYIVEGTGQTRPV